jgi:hypothetical protein
MEDIGYRKQLEEEEEEEDERRRLGRQLETKVWI